MNNTKQIKIAKYSLDPTLHVVDFQTFWIMVTVES